jgi:hypothetical protein
MYQRVGHESAPTSFSELVVSGSPEEHLEWLGPNNLPLRFEPGERGVVEARIATRRGQAVIR